MGVIQVYNAINNLIYSTKGKANALLDVIVKLTHFDIVDSPICIILNHWFAHAVVPRDILILLTAFTYDADSVYNDIVNVKREYTEHWQKKNKANNFIDVPYILGAMNAEKKPFVACAVVG